MSVTPAPAGAPSVSRTSVAPARRLVSENLIVELTGPRAVLHGDCPTECCHYGEWTVGATSVHEAPSVTSRRVGRTSQDEKVRADSGVVIVDRVGLAIVLRDTALATNPARLTAGDTLLLLTEGETGFSAVWRGRVLQEIDGSEPRTIRIVRRPTPNRWWSHVSSQGRELKGWIDMDRARVSGADACGQ